MLSDPRIAKGMREQFELRRQMLDSGARRLGWKIGFGSPAAQSRLGTSAALVGFLTDRTLLRPGSRCSLAGWRSPLLEPEFAVHLGADPGPQPSEEAVRAAVRGLGAAIELVDTDPDLTDVEQILASDIFHRHVILGPVVEARQGGSLDGVSARLLRDGEVVASTDDPEALTGSLVDLIAHVATLLTALGEPLREGDVVITGSVVPPLAVASGQHLTADLGALGSVEVQLG